MGGIGKFAALRALLAVGLLLAGLAVAPVAVGQTATPAQMEAFRNLPPDQQQAVLQSMGGGQGSIQRDADVAAPETVQPRAMAQAYDDVTRRTGDADLRGLDTVLIDVRVKPTDPVSGRSRSQDEMAALQGTQARILKGNPYKLDAAGILRIPGVRPIPLAGLAQSQATARLNSEPVLTDFQLSLSLLPLAKLDAEALKPFGYDLFAGVPSTFAPVSDIPVPSQYVVGPGDRLEVQLIGSTKGRYSLVVNRDGNVMFPELGSIPVSGVTFDVAKSRIEARVGEQMIGAQAIVSMGDLRSIRVFVLGEAERPGSYTVSGLSTITNALFASGGVKTIGSLRNIQLKRAGRVVTRLDLYDLLLNGDTSSDVRLLPGDVIFIPPVGPTVGVTGEIRRPAIYELVGENTVADLVRLGGGLTPKADPRLATIERIEARRERIVLDVDLDNAQKRGTRLQNGDLLTVPAAKPSFANEVRIDGNVYRPGMYQYRSGLRLADVLPSIEELRPNSDLNYVLIRREQPESRRVEVLSADLAQAWLTPTSEANPLLAPRDQIFVFNLETGRSQFIDPVNEAMRLQASRSEPSRVVSVSGPVHFPGDYPLEPGMRVSGLIRAAGGLGQQAYGGQAELARYEVRDGQRRITEMLDVDLGRVIAGDTTADLQLAPFDLLSIKSVSEWSEQDTVAIEGEVRFPGEYPIARGETLRSVVARAGGLTPLAFPAGGVFTREVLRERERQQLTVLADKLKKDLAVLALEASQSGPQGSAQSSQTMAVGQSLLADLQSAQPIGRLVIDLPSVLNAEPGSPNDVVLRKGDRLRVPRIAQEVTVLGEVQYPTSHLYSPDLTRDDYLRMSGGTNQRANAGRIYVVRANGSVDSGGGSKWFRDKSGMQPGDTIVVPLDAERMRPLTLWTQVTTIIFNLAVAVAAIGSI